ncbi:MAG: MotA/TolQ/ExbB proton channel family protein [Bacteroidetes bacterium]|jgi:biopolymer transport protein ExbB|nr:MotA/TolQ/ExbB proton channel family protein [Bacteroidota bacterium]
MKKTIVLILAFALFVGMNLSAYAQETATEPETTEVESADAPDATEAASEEIATEEAAPEEGEAVAEASEEVEADDKKSEKGEGIAVIRDKFIEGGAGFMALPLLCLILGLAIVIERLLSLFSVSSNSDKFIKKVEDALISGGIESAKDVARSTPGPVASIFYQGLDRADEGLDHVEKSVVSYGEVQMGQLEKGLVWISLFIALAPMLGFMGTVIGMIKAFDDIQNAGDISPAIVAKGIKVALLTTVAGLIVAIILQIFYNLLVSKIDSIVNNMEDASIRLVDMLIKNNVVKTS